MAQNTPTFDFKITPKRFVYYLWLVRTDPTRSSAAGICSALAFVVGFDCKYRVPAGSKRSTYALNVAKVFYHMTQRLDKNLKWSTNYLFPAYQWKERDEFLDEFIQAMCDRYNIPHPKTLA